jgi:small nuclear ribonucleoprotein (snRNP)-like protein
MDTDDITFQVLQHNVEIILGNTAKYKASLVSAEEFCNTEPFQVVVVSPPYIPQEEELELQV